MALPLTLCVLEQVGYFPSLCPDFSISKSGLIIPTSSLPQMSYKGLKGIVSRWEPVKSAVRWGAFRRKVVLGEGPVFCSLSCEQTSLPVERGFFKGHI